MWWFNKLLVMKHVYQKFSRIIKHKSHLFAMRMQNKKDAWKIEMLKETYCIWGNIVSKTLHNIHVCLSSNISILSFTKKLIFVILAHSLVSTYHERMYIEAIKNDRPIIKLSWRYAVITFHCCISVLYQWFIVPYMQQETK